jgi:hypothetical protein
MEEKKTDTLGAELIPEAKDKVSHEDAEKVRALVRLDIAKFRQQKEQFLRAAADCDLAIAQQEVALADLDRREVGVAYPEPPEAPKEPPKADLGQPRGPGAEGESK